MRRYADFAGSKINEAFDYSHGNDLWKEKLDYTNSWLSAHISDANAIGKPLIIEEFGKAKAAAKVYTGEFPHGIVPGLRSSPHGSLLSACCCKKDLPPAICPGALWVPRRRRRHLRLVWYARISLLEPQCISEA